MNYSKIPFIKKIYSKYKILKESLDTQIFQLSVENINLRFKIKSQNSEKIKVVFICWRPTVWGSLKSVYETMKNDSDFEVNIVVIPNKKELPKLFWNHENYESEGGEKYWLSDDVVCGYDEKTNTWLDIKDLQPDFVFFQQPYNNQRSALYKSDIVSKYAKICYVAYYAFFNTTTNEYINDGCTPIDFMKHVSFYFAQNSKDESFITNKMEKANNNIVRVIKSGFPRYDVIKNNFNTLKWNFPNDKKFKVIWTPRWALDEGNCHFFKYNNLFLDYCRKNEDLDFIFRPHPQAFQNYLSTNAITKNELNRLKENYENGGNTKIDYSTEYLDLFYTSDCLISDTSSMVAEYFLTGKPIIYCFNKNAVNNFSRTEGYTSSFYFAENWNEVVEILERLKKGIDPLREMRIKFIESDFYISKSGAAKIICDTIKSDFNRS